MSILIIFLLLFVRTLLKDCIITPSRQALGRRGLRLDFEFGEGHALNAFNTTDKGLVYVDCTRGFSTPIIAEFTDSAKREEREHDKIAYVVEGKEYGLISIDKGNIARILVL